MTRQWAQPAPPTPTTGHNTCPCGAPTPHVLCTNCLDRLLQHVSDTPDLLTELDTTITRQDRVNRPTPTTQAPTPADIHSTDPATALAALAQRSPYNRQASRAKGDYRLAIHLAAHATGWKPATTDPDHNTRQAAQHILETGPRTAHHPDAAHITDSVIRAHRAAMRAIDTCPDRILYGPCPTCAAELRGQPDRTTTRCYTCHTSHAVVDITRRRVEQMDRELVNLDSLHRVAELAGIQVSKFTIYSWKRRGKLRPVGRAPLGDDLYRVRDLVDLARKNQPAQEEDQ